jgi:hypothetical protein
MDKREKAKAAASKEKRKEAMKKAEALRKPLVEAAQKKQESEEVALAKSEAYGAHLRQLVTNFLDKQEEYKKMRLRGLIAIKEEERRAKMPRPREVPKVVVPPRVDPEVLKDAQDLKTFLNHPARRLLSRKAIDVLHQRKESVGELNELLKKDEFRAELEVLARK